ncbi:uncharacterized protein [Musca autumnalis]|uniref:uncharacterized protein n=1 Tax=Musca autumnalis TaxID=221902 RepID=UPI003CF2F279
MLIQLEARPLKINIIQVYAPTADKSKEEVEEFYEDIKYLMNMTKHHEITIVQGDFNAKVGQDIVPGITGKHGLGERNERGSRMIQFCQEHNMKITNTMFSLPPRRLYTWKSPQDRPTHIVRNQIDYILINKRYSSFVTKTSTYPGADVPSDHVLLMTKLQTKLRTNMKKKIRKRMNVEKLDEPSIKTEIKALIGQEFSKIEGMDSESIWKSVKQSLKSIADNNLGSNPRKRKNEWMTTEILGLMEERRKYKNSNYELYHELNKEVQSAIRAAKNDNLNKQCQEIERLQELHDDFNLHKKIKEAAGIYRKSLPKVLYNSNNEAVFDITEKKAIWQNYITSLYTDENRSNYDIREPEPQVGTPITKHETEAAIKSLKMKKACGPDEIPSEILKLIEGDNINILEPQKPSKEETIREGKNRRLRARRARRAAALEARIFATYNTITGEFHLQRPITRGRGAFTGTGGRRTGTNNPNATAIQGSAANNPNHQPIEGSGTEPATNNPNLPPSGPEIRNPEEEDKAMN